MKSQPKEENNITVAHFLSILKNAAFLFSMIIILNQFYTGLVIASLVFCIVTVISLNH